MVNVAVELQYFSHHSKKQTVHLFYSSITLLHIHYAWALCHFGKFFRSIWSYLAHYKCHYTRGAYLYSVNFNRHNFQFSKQKKKPADVQTLLRTIPTRIHLCQSNGEQVVKSFFTGHMEFQCCQVVSKSWPRVVLASRGNNCEASLRRV